MKQNQIYIANLGKYNEGELVGDWINLPFTESELNELFIKIKLGRYEIGENENKKYVHGYHESGNYYEEWAIHDYDLPFTIDNLEFYNLERLNEEFKKIDNLDNDDYKKFIEVYKNVANECFPTMCEIDLNDYVLHENDIDNVVYDLVNDIYDLPEIVRMYFDYEAYKSDLLIEGQYIEVDSGVLEVLK